jgi:hypothetical protein
MGKRCKLAHTGDAGHAIPVNEAGTRLGYFVRINQAFARRRFASGEVIRGLWLNPCIVLGIVIKASTTSSRDWLPCEVLWSRSDSVADLLSKLS